MLEPFRHFPVLWKMPYKRIIVKELNVLYTCIAPPNHVPNCTKIFDDTSHDSLSSLTPPAPPTLYIVHWRIIHSSSQHMQLFQLH